MAPFSFKCFLNFGPDRFVKFTLMKIDRTGTQVNFEYRIVQGKFRGNIGNNILGLNRINKTDSDGIQNTTECNLNLFHNFLLLERYSDFAIMNRVVSVNITQSFWGAWSGNVSSLKYSNIAPETSLAIFFRKPNW